VSKKTFVDTVFVVALINQRDQYHERAVQLADSCDGKHFLITDVLLLEIGNRDAMTSDQHFVQAGFRALMQEAG
jgi:hypothetical protein